MTGLEDFRRLPLATCIDIKVRVYQTATRDTGARAIKETSVDFYNKSITQHGTSLIS